MEHWDYNGNSAIKAEYPPTFSHQLIVNEVLRLSLEPYLFTEQLERILVHLVDCRELLLRKAAVFFADHQTQRLALKVSHGFSRSEQERCANIRFGLCHCGRAALTGTIHYFSFPPPFCSVQTSDQVCAGHYCIPVIRDGQPIGVLALYADARHRPSTETEQLFESIALILASVIENQKMDQQLLELVNDLRLSIIGLREEKQFTESIIQGLDHGLLVTDPQGNIIKSNSVARHILEPFLASLDGQNLQAVVGDHHAMLMKDAGHGDTASHGREVVLSAAGGEETILSLTCAARNDARGERVGYIISLTDVTELRYVRREMEKMNRLSTVAEIASAVAHEVRNPLAGIKIMAQSIEEDAVGNEQQLECSRRIIRQVDRLNELLSEFFSYARPVVPNKRPVSIRSILAETIPLIGNRLMKNSIELVEEIAPDLPNVIADPHQMQQVFLNLVLNAIDAIRQNGTISISARLLTSHKLGVYRKRNPGLLSDGRYVLVVVADNGAGMPPKVAEKAFEPFFTTKTSGTGLGLSIVYRTLRENGAAVTLESRQGKGTSINMFLQTGE